MSTELFYKLLDDLAGIPDNHAFGIALHRINEPLLDSRMRLFHDEVARRYPQARHQFFSNGTTLKEGNFEWMGVYTNASLSISLNSMDENKRQQLMGFGLKVLFKNLDNLHEHVRHGAFKPPVTVVAPHLNEDHSVEFTRACQERWPEFHVGIRPFFVWMGSTPTGGDYRGVAGLPNNPDSKQLSLLPCGQWFDLHILASGYVTKCCIDETGHQGQEQYDVRKRNALEIYRDGRDHRHRLSGRGEITDCRGCFHLG